MDLKAEDPLTGAKADPSDAGGSIKSIVLGIASVGLGAGILTGGIALYNKLSEATGDATPDFVLD